MHRLRCFGQAAIEDPSGNEVRLRSQKHLALLLYLANERGKRHSRERLSSLFWGTESRLARHSLSQALYDITQNLPALELHRSVREVGLGEDGMEYDAETFTDAIREEKLDDAVGLYRGAFAPDLEEAGGEDFERWIDEERHRYRRLAETALLRHMSRCDDQARWGEMCFSATRLISMNPLNEEAHRAYMRALWLQGNQEAAISHFEAEHERLQRELPGGLSEETSELVRRIRSSRPALASSAVHETERLPMIGREEEFGELKRLLAETLDGEGRLAIVHGEAGMGKTRLLEEFHEFAALEGARVLDSRCYSAETDVPFGPVVDGLDEIAAELAERAEDDANYFQLGHLFPEVFEATAPKLDSFLGAGAGRRRLYEEVADLLRRSCSEQPIVWLIDDAHWMDASSTSLVHYLVRRLGEHPVMIVCTAREGGSKFIEHYREWEPRNPSTAQTELTLTGLDLSDIETLVESVYPSSLTSDAARHIHRLTGGNPLYINELLEHNVAERIVASDDGNPHFDPDGSALDYSKRLSESLSRRVSGLSPSSLRILEIAAVAGRSTTIELLTKTSGYEQSRVFEDVRELYRRGILLDRDGHVAFSHDLLRSYIYDTLGEIQRSALHLTVAEILAKHDEGEELRALAHHFSEAGDEGRAYEYSLHAAQKALAFNAHEQAIHLAQASLQHARQRQDRAPALQVLADAEVAAGKLSAADSTLREMLELQVDGTSDWLATKLRLADLLLDRSRLHEALTLLENLTSRLGEMPNDNLECERVAWAEHLYIKALLKTGAFEEARAALRRVDTIVSSGLRPSPNIRTISAITHAAYELHCGSPESAVEYLSSSPDWIQDADYELKLKATYIASMVFRSSGDWDRGERWLERAEAWTTYYSDVTNLIGVLNNKVVYSLEKGEWEKVKALAARLSAVSDSHDRTANASVALKANLGHACFFSGKTEEAIDHYEHAIERITSSENPGLKLQYQCSLALASLQDQDFPRAHDLWDDITKNAGVSDKPRPEIQEYYKYLWLKAFFGVCEGSDEGIGELYSVGRMELGRDRPTATKILWLAHLLQHALEAGGILTRGELRSMSAYRTLQDQGMQWFAYSTNRWLARAIRAAGRRVRSMA